MPSPPLQPLSYDTPPVPPRSKPVFDLPVACVCIAFATTLTIVHLLFLPKMEAVFRDFGAKLPAITIFFLGLSRLDPRVFLPFIWIAALLPPFVIPLLRPWPPRRPNYRPRYAFLLLLLLYVAFAGTMVVALFLPYVRLIDSVAGK